MKVSIRNIVNNKVKVRVIISELTRGEVQGQVGFKLSVIMRVRVIVSVRVIVGSG